MNLKKLCLLKRKFSKMRMVLSKNKPYILNITPIYKRTIFFIFEKHKLYEKCIQKSNTKETSKNVLIANI